jgi:hypothetical protein
MTWFFEMGMVDNAFSQEKAFLGEHQGGWFWAIATGLGSS